VSIRQHEIELSATEPASANRLPAVVTRQVFLGAARDYTVVLSDKTELRVTAPPSQDIAPGQEVWLRLPAERCRALTGGNEG
jgi:iron(III) transport system ATP-binding protein